VPVPIEGVTMYKPTELPDSLKHLSHGQVDKRPWISISMWIA
jgi:hypothetical protein